MVKIYLPLLVGNLLLAPITPLYAEADPIVSDALQEYFDFISYGAGQITAEQIPEADYAKFYILDVRDAEQYAKAHIPNAVNIEWRQVYANRDKLPRDKPILAYCNSGSFASQVALALRLDGFENVKLLYGGFERYLLTTHLVARP
ncbi:rhodanese-like domain-containing protein [Ectothiorhodospiraceae bacterium BW-2]|nr:rhodanese-like domain-containing protein [Ectothiorhodospiraceae bacterium BW-2]